ncbi:MAG: response regulator transcription factor [Caldilineaceae bacterium]
MKVLLIADDPHEESILLGVLQMAGFSVAVATPQVEAEKGAVLDQSAELIVVTAAFDDPVNAIYQLRTQSEAPLIIVVDATTERLHAQMIEAGVDHVFTRPLSVRLLTAYGQALLRRNRNALSPAASNAAALGGRSAVRLDPAHRTVQVAGQPPQRLSQLEFRLLHTLMLNRGQVIPTETIVERVWGYSGEGDRSLVRGLINRLRAKIETNPENPHYIRTVARIGYMFSQDDA